MSVCTSLWKPPKLVLLRLSVCSTVVIKFLCMLLSIQESVCVYFVNLTALNFGSCVFECVVVASVPVLASIYMCRFRQCKAKSLSSSVISSMSLG